MDGLFLHPSFTEDFRKEQKEMVKAFAKNGGQNVGEKDFDQFFAAAGEKTSYRKLLRDTIFRKCLYHFLLFFPEIFQPKKNF